MMPRGSAVDVVPTRNVPPAPLLAGLLVTMVGVFRRRSPIAFDVLYRLV
jgi:hypothetical protein